MSGIIGNDVYLLYIYITFVDVFAPGQVAMWLGKIYYSTDDITTPHKFQDSATIQVVTVVII